MIFIYCCRTCGWIGPDLDARWFALGDENVDACPICYDESFDWDDPSDCAYSLKIVGKCEAR